MELKEQALKAAARRISKKSNLTHSQVLEELSAAFGQTSWNVFKRIFKGANIPDAHAGKPWHIVELSDSDIKDIASLKKIMSEYDIYRIGTNEIHSRDASNYGLRMGYITSSDAVLDATYHLITKKQDTALSIDLAKAISQEGFSDTIRRALNSSYMSCAKLNKQGTSYRLAYTDDKSFNDYGSEFFKNVLINIDMAYANAIMTHNSFKEVEDCLLNETVYVDDIFADRKIPDVFVGSGGLLVINDGFVAGCSASNRIFRRGTIFTEFNKTASAEVVVSACNPIPIECSVTKKIADISNKETSCAAIRAGGKNFVKGFITRTIMNIVDAQSGSRISCGGFMVYPKDGALAARIPGKTGEIIFTAYNAAGDAVPVPGRVEQFDFNRWAESLSDSFRICVEFAA